MEECSGFSCIGNIAISWRLLLIFQLSNVRDWVCYVIFGISRRTAHPGFPGGLFFRWGQLGGLFFRWGQLGRLFVRLAEPIVAQWFMIRVPYLHPSRLEQEITVIWPPKLNIAGPDLGRAQITKVDTFWTFHPADPTGRTAHPADPTGRTAHLESLGGLFFRRSEIPYKFDIPSCEEVPSPLWGCKSLLVVPSAVSTKYEHYSLWLRH